MIVVEESMTPSHVAAAHGEVDVLAFLLGRRANANGVDEEKPDSIGPRS